MFPLLQFFFIKNILLIFEIVKGLVRAQVYLISDGDEDEIKILYFIVIRNKDEILLQG